MSSNLIDRNPVFAYGPRFFRGADGADMFEHRIDARSCIGPRIATKTDKQNHPGKWAEHLAEMTAEADRGLKRKAK